MATSEATLAQLRKIAGITESTTPKSSVHNKKMVVQDGQASGIKSKEEAKPKTGTVSATSPKSSVKNKDMVVKDGQASGIKTRDAKPKTGTVASTSPKSSVKNKMASVKENDDADADKADSVKPKSGPALSKEDIDDIRRTVKAHGDVNSAKKAVGEMHKDPAKREHAHKLVDRFAREGADIDSMLKVAGVDDPLKHIDTSVDVIIVTEGEKVKCVFGGADCFAAARKFLAVARGAVAKGKPYKYEGHKFMTMSPYSSK